jgi:hypothetical protein
MSDGWFAEYHGQPVSVARAVTDWLNGEYERDGGLTIRQEAVSFVERLLDARDRAMVELPDGGRIRPVWLRELLATELRSYVTDHVQDRRSYGSMEHDLLGFALHDVSWEAIAETMLAEHDVHFRAEDHIQQTLREHDWVLPTAVVDDALRGWYHGGGVEAEVEQRVRKAAHDVLPRVAVANALRDYVQTELRQRVSPTLASNLVSTVLDDVDWRRLADVRLTPQPRDKAAGRTANARAEGPNSSGSENR